MSPETKRKKKKSEISKRATKTSLKPKITFKQEGDEKGIF